MTWQGIIYRYVRYDTDESEEICGFGQGVLRFCAREPAFVENICTYVCVAECY